MTDAQRGRHLCGSGIPGVARPVGPVVVTAAAAGQLRDGGESPGGGRRFGARPLLDGGDDGRIVGRPELAIEHAF
jgi:hypothetical protein